MPLGEVFERFIQEAPISVMFRTLLEHALDPAELDRLFEENATRQYTREVLFSAIVELMGTVDCGRTAVLIAQWMAVGFVHGVMNTDNMSILGVTIDYRPYGWLEPYETGWTPNTTDFGHRRYAFGQQPGVAPWNLAMLALPGLRGGGHRVLRRPLRAALRDLPGHGGRRLGGGRSCGVIP